MVLINKQEKELILRKLPWVHIRRTMTQKSKRHKYYMEEDARALRLLRSIRNSE